MPDYMTHSSHKLSTNNYIYIYIYIYITLSWTEFGEAIT